MFYLIETFECDDDYGQPTAREEETGFATFNEAFAAAAESCSDFGTRIIFRPTPEEI